MAENKRFYWIKLKDTFMTSDAVDFLMGQKNGSEYVVLYQMLCLKTINTNGELARQIGEVLIPYDAPKIQRDCKYFDIDTIIVALELYKKLGLIFESENGILKIANFDNLIGSETKWAEYKRVSRKEEEKTKLLENVQSLSKKCPHRERDKDKEKEKEKEIHKEKEKGKDTAPNGAIYIQQPGDVPLISVEDENKDIPFIATNDSLGDTQNIGVDLKKSIEQTTAPTIEQEKGVEDEKKHRAKAVNKVSEATIIDYFATTWEKYPRQVNKIQALRTYKYKLDGMDSELARETANKIYSMLQSQIKAWAREGEHGRDMDKIPHFSTWLNANFADADGKLRCR